MPRPLGRAGDVLARRARLQRHRAGGRAPRHRAAPHRARQAPGGAAALGERSDVFRRRRARRLELGALPALLQVPPVRPSAGFGRSGRGCRASTSAIRRTRSGTSRPSRSRSATRATGRRSSGGGSAPTTIPGSTACASAWSTSRTAQRRRTRARSTPLFVRPEWRWRVARRRRVRVHAEGLHVPRQGREPRHPEYRGYVDWRVRYDAGGEWIATADRAPRHRRAKAAC